MTFQDFKVRGKQNSIQSWKRSLSINYHLYNAKVPKDEQKIESRTGNFLYNSSMIMKSAYLEKCVFRTDKKKFREQFQLSTKEWNSKNKY